MACAVLGLRAHIEHDHVAARQPLLELVRRELLHLIALAQVLVGKHADLGHVPDGHVAHSRPEIPDALAREPVEDARALAARAHKPRAREHLQMLRGVGDALRDLAGDLLHRPLALGEQSTISARRPLPSACATDANASNRAAFAAHSPWISSYHLNT